jgi:TRAP-type C4-dicarboxylate transport system substrate-binding protein
MNTKIKLPPALAFLLLLCVSALSFIGMAVLQPADEEVIHWHMPMAFPDSNYQTTTAKNFAERVNSCTNGRIKITIHANGSLFKGIEIKRAVQTGQASIGERLLSTHANEDMLFTVDSIPFLASGFEQSERLWKLAEPAMNEKLEEENLYLLYSVPWPPQGIYFGREIESTEDVVGMRFRSYSSATGRIAELAGMIPVLIESAELTQALATGVVQTFMASGSSGYDSKIWEHLSYYYDIEAWRPRNYVIVNKEDYLSLPEGHRQCLRQESAQAQREGTEESIRLAKWYLEQLKANGMQVVKPGPRLKSELDKIGAAMTEEWLASTGAKGQKILDAYLGGNK